MSYKDLVDGDRVKKQRVFLRVPFPGDIPQIGPATVAALRLQNVRSRIDVLERSADAVGGWKNLAKLDGISTGRAALLWEWANAGIDWVSWNDPQDPSWFIRMKAAEYSTVAPMLASLAQDPDLRVAERALANPRCPPHAILVAIHTERLSEIAEKVASPESLLSAAITALMGGHTNFKVSSALAAIIGVPPGTPKPVPCSVVVEKLWGYIRKHGLQETTNHRRINADDTLNRVFGDQAQVSLGEMAKLVAKHLTRFAVVP